MRNQGCGALLDIDRWTDAVLDRVALRTQWSPIGVQVAIMFDDCGDAALIDHTVCGTIRAHETRTDGTPSDLLIELDGDIDYAGHYKRSGIHWLVARPCLRWRRTNRLMLGWAAVRIVDAPSFRDATYDHTVATGRVGLR
jgi:hypothetical protein